MNICCLLAGNVNSSVSVGKWTRTVSMKTRNPSVCSYAWQTLNPFVLIMFHTRPTFNKCLSYKEGKITQLATAILRLEHVLQVTDNLWHNSEVISELLNPRAMHIRFESDAFELLAWFRFSRAWFVRVHSNTYWLRQRRDFTQTYPRNKLKRTWERLNHIYSFKR